MNKLFDTIATGDQITLFQQVESELKTALAGQSDQFLYNIDYYLSKIPETRASMAQRARTQILDYSATYGWRYNRNDLVDELDDYYLSIFQTLEDYVVVGIDMEKAGYPAALYTRNLAILSYLLKGGYMEEGTTDEKVFANLCGTKTEKSLKERNFVTIRLDVVGIKDEHPIFKPMTPQSNLDIGGGKKYVIIPVPFMYMVEVMLKSVFEQTPFKFTKSSFNGQISQIATLSGNVVRKVYGGSDERLVEAKIRKTRVGYDISRLRIFAYDLESSLSSIGVSSFRPEMLDVVVAFSDAEIDKSRYNIDFALLRGIFRTRIRSSKTAQLDALNLLDLTGYANLKDKQAALIDACDRKSDKEIYWLMKNNPEVFGDIEDGLEKRERMIPKFLKNMDHMSLPVTEGDRAKMIRSLLDRGVVKFTAISNKGSIFESVVTNNPQVLERMLGKDYVKNFESIRNKLYHVKEMLEKKEIKNRKHLEKVGVEYNLLGYIEPTVFFSDAIDRGDVSDALYTVKEGIQRLIQKSTGKVIPTHSIVCRNVHASDTQDFFVSVNVNTVIDIEFSEI